MKKTEFLANSISSTGQGFASFILQYDKWKKIKSARSFKMHKYSS